MKKLILLFLSFTLFSATCSKKEPKAATPPVNPGYSQEGFKSTYLYNNPDTIMILDKKLTEISGLSYSNYSGKLVAINDEKGIIYYINSSSGDITNEIDFGKADDYEGITVGDSLIYVAESNGNIKIVDEKSTEKLGEYDGPLSVDNDIEGLVYNPSSRSLLLAAKGNSRIKDNVKSEKAIFSLHLEKGIMEKTPFLSLNLNEEINKLKTKNVDQNGLANLSLTSRLNEFAPSGLARHPKTNDIFIVSSRGKLLVICSQQGDVKAIILLDQELHKQPEGICFDADHNLYISNEGRGKSAKIFKYRAPKIAK